jgi:hypothetical protein
MTVQVTAESLEPETVAANCCCHLSGIAIAAGEILTVIVWGGDTMMVAEAVLVASATLTAVTVYVPAVVGAVNSPLVEIVPPDADQVTAVLPVIDR